MEAHNSGIGWPSQEIEETRKLHHDLRSLMDKYEEIAKKIGTTSLVDQLLTSINLLYRVEIMAVPLPPKSKVPAIDMYKGSKDRVEHLEIFKAYMTLHGFFGEITCWPIPLTLKGMARGWFGVLWLGSINIFETLGRQFLPQFMASRRQRSLAAYLLTVKQKEEESLKAYLAWFNRERMTADNKDKKIMLAALFGRIWPRSPFMVELARKTPFTLREFMDKIDNFINAEDTPIALTARLEKREEQKPKGNSKNERDGGSRSKRNPHEGR